VVDRPQKKPMAFCHCVHGEHENVAANYSDVMWMQVNALG